MYDNNTAHEIIPCKKWVDGKDESIPGFKFGGTDSIDAWEWECFTYDPLNETSKKQAMRRAIESGIDKIRELEQEVREEMAKEQFAASIQDA